MLTAAVFYCFLDEVKNTLILIYPAFLLGVIPHGFVCFQLNTHPWLILDNLHYTLKGCISLYIPRDFHMLGFSNWPFF